ncbi:MAG: hypothetical protein RIE32_03515 [Phycisphaerales bacterium]
MQVIRRRALDPGDLLLFGTRQGAGRVVRGGALLVLLTLASLAWGLTRRRIDTSSRPD